ncbi:MAG: serine hydrolase [Bacteroidota bacterium]
MKAFLPFLLLLCFASQAASQQLYFPPTDDSNWETLAPEELNYCPDSIAALYDYLEQEQTKSFILLKDGKIVLERYFGSYTQDSLWVWFSAGKSLRALLVGIAQEQGYLDIHQPTSDFLGKGWTSLPEEKEDLITIWHQLTMTTGFNPFDFSCTDPQCLTYQADAGTFWYYHNAPYSLLKDVLESATGQNINALTRDWVRNKIGWDFGFWLPIGDNTFYFSKARDMARFGLLIQNKGIWDQTPVLQDSAYFNEMVNSSQDLNPAYGYLWWLNGQSSYIPPSFPNSINGAITPDAPADMFAAAGALGQYVSISPSEGLVVIRQGTSDNQDLASISLLNDVWKRIGELECLSTSTAEPLTEAITIAPTLTHDQVNIQSRSGQTPRVELYSLSGELLREWRGVNTISLASYPSGMYFLRVKQGATVKVSKIVKS